MICNQSNDGNEKANEKGSGGDWRANSNSGVTSLSMKMTIKRNDNNNNESINKPIIMAAVINNQ